MTAYRVYRDGNLLTEVGGTSAVVKDSGPGEHVFRVTAVNGLGEGAASRRHDHARQALQAAEGDGCQGRAGGKRTAGAKWKAPADAGGFAITGYKIAVFKKNGNKVDTKIVKPSKLKFLFKLKAGRYFFKVRARNTDRWGPWSKPTDVVRPR